MPTKIGGTSWLSHTELAKSCLARGYEGFVPHLGQVAENGEKMLSPLPKVSLRFCWIQISFTISIFMQDLLLSLSKLSMVIQENATTVSNRG